jgi:hypothetical protein
MRTDDPRARGSGGLAASTLLALSLVLGCGPREEPARRRPAAAPAKTAAAVPSFRSDILPVLSTNCAGADGCHGDHPTDKVDLDLRAGNAYHDLVDGPAKARPGAVLVKPGDPTASFLVAKLTATQTPSEGKAMPIDPRTGAPVSMTPPAREFVDTVLRPWIEAGAPDN